MSFLRVVYWYKRPYTLQHSGKYKWEVMVSGVFNVSEGLAESCPFMGLSTIKKFYIEPRNI